ncbi:MAG: hypothetical protein OHK0056_25010 [Bacteriovoracaceae bacterium]
MQKILLSLFTLLILVSCSTKKINQPSENHSSIEYQSLSDQALDLKSIHALGGLPTSKEKIRVLEYKNYIVGFSDKYKLPLYTQRNFKDYPKDCSEKGRGASIFTPDSRLPKNLQLTQDDFDDPNCKSKDKKIRTEKCLRRGHLTANADVCTHSDRKETFKTTNIAPQIQNSFNSGLWSSLEKCVQQWAKQDPKLIVNTGIIFDESPKLLNNKVPIPKYFYKIILRPNSNERIAFLMENKHYKKNEKGVSRYKTTVDKIESLTRMDFLPQFNKGLNGSYNNTSLNCD